MGRRNLDEIRAAVGRFPQAEVVDIDRLLVQRIGGDMHVVPGSIAQILVVGQAGPGFAKIIGPERPGLVSDSTSAQTRPDLAGETASPILPKMPSWGRPLLRVMSVHVSPPSIDFQMPLSGPPLESSQKLRWACQMEA